MSLLFWVFAAMMLGLALAFVLPLLLRGKSPAVSGAAAEARRRLASLETAWKDGHLEEADYQRRRAEIAAVLLEAVDQPASIQRSPKIALLLLVLAPALALGLYFKLGTPRALSVATTGPVTQTASTSDAAPQLADALNQLEARLASNPEDVDGWFLLGRTYRTMNRFAEARDAYERALELAPRTPPIMIELAEAIAFASGEASLPESAKRLLDEAIALDPNSQKGLWMLGLDAFNAGDYRQALSRWEPLLAQLEPGGGAAVQVAEQVNLARERLGMAAMEDPPAQAAPAAPANVAAAPGDQSSEAGPGLTVQVSLDPGLADRVQPGDTLFVFARAHNGPPMPLAIARLTAGQLPATVRLDASMAMMPAMSLDQFPEVVVGARISRSGNASAQPGDLEALSPPVSNLRKEPVELEIATVL